MSKSSTSESEVDLLLVEDNPGDVRLLKETFADAQITNTIHVTNDGQEALNFIHQRDEFETTPQPDIILLDFNLPRVNGDEVLTELKDDPELSQILVIVMTGSEAEKDVVQSEAPSANAYLTKPVEPEKFLDFIQSSEDFGISIIHLEDHDD